jgi:hypothetical protein
VGSMLVAAMLLDGVLWALVLCGLETVHAPAGYRRAADLAFEFPYSHSLIASLGWSGAGFAAAWWMCRTPAHRLRAALVVAAAVFSHFVLDWIVHVPELPLAGRGSAKLGLGLWLHLPLAWTLEASLAAVGLWLYLRGATLTRGRRVALILVMMGVVAMTIAGQASTAPPPPPGLMAATSLLTIGLLVAFGWWVERPCAG